MINYIGGNKIVLSGNWSSEEYFQIQDEQNSELSLPLETDSETSETLTSENYTYDSLDSDKEENSEPSVPTEEKTIVEKSKTLVNLKVTTKQILYGSKISLGLVDSSEIEHPVDLVELMDLISLKDSSDLVKLETLVELYKSEKQSHSNIKHTNDKSNNSMIAFIVLMVLLIAFFIAIAILLYKDIIKI
ncbi:MULTISPECIES: hypothetical protein [Candidatus Ichthyocystis]|uniref:Putative membrane protein n=1 Tax=Candidatus Ichthyocystis hellenicum TaxID=1561003 RepID=A0A0S4M5N9_9BURK|nr:MULTISPECIES: hypothetical protein [Ichthyocystis]CUT17565.1 putative membrane protein [Candidatus Ichthyocystis hellenicum]